MSKVCHAHPSIKRRGLFSNIFLLLLLINTILISIKVKKSIVCVKILRKVSYLLCATASVIAAASSSSSSSVHKSLLSHLKKIASAQEGIVGDLMYLLYACRIVYFTFSSRERVYCSFKKYLHHNHHHHHQCQIHPAGIAATAVAVVVLYFLLSSDNKQLWVLKLHLVKVSSSL